MRYRTPFLFLLVAAIWGSTFPAVRAGVEVVPPVLFAAIEFGPVGTSGPEFSPAACS